jgi:penicillin-binding protein 2
MTRRLPFPLLAIFALILGLAFAPESPAKTPKKSARAAASKKGGRSAKTTRAARGRATPSRKGRREVARSRDTRRSRRDVADRRGNRASRNSRSRRESVRVLSRKELKRLSPRERRAYLARQSRARREAARRAAIARAIYLARIRAQDQAFRDQTRANILRDETTGEDLEVRRIAMEALGNHAGSVVVMDPKTGRVYTVVNQEWALRKGFKPCSTFKLVTGLAGLNDNVINPAS